MVRKVAEKTEAIVSRLQHKTMMTERVAGGRNRVNARQELLAVFEKEGPILVGKQVSPSVIDLKLK